jgi:stage II sporulation protein AA (anti-sigma F factor antagonist)
MDITTEKVGEALLARVHGELDLNTARSFRARLEADLDRFGARHLVLDLDGVDFIDSSGMGAILGRYKRVVEKGGQLAVCRPREHVKRLLELAGVTRIIRVCRDAREALALLGQKEGAAGGDFH